MFQNQMISTGRNNLLSTCRYHLVPASSGEVLHGFFSLEYTYGENNHIVLVYKNKLYLTVKRN